MSLSLSMPEPRKRLARTHTSTHQLKNIRQAFLFAQSQDVPMNTWLTVNFRDWKGEDGRKVIAQAKLIERFRKSLVGFCKDEKRSIPQAWVYVLENPWSGGVGPHLHYLLHLPLHDYEQHRQDLGNRIRKVLGWTKPEIETLEAAKLAASPEEEDATHLPFFIQRGDALPDNEALKRLRYMAKSVDPDEMITEKSRESTIGCYAGIDGNGNAMPRHGSRITLQRQSPNRPSKCAGVSGSLDASARKAAGWVDADEDFEWLKRR